MKLRDWMALAAEVGFNASWEQDAEGEEDHVLVLRAKGVVDGKEYVMPLVISGMTEGG